MLHPTSRDVDDFAALPSMTVSDTFLEKQQAHASPLTAFGDQIDNGHEAGVMRISMPATRSDIVVLRPSVRPCVAPDAYRAPAFPSLNGAGLP